MIKVLELQHFGQFHNKRIEVEEGLNLFHGENEKGKSTIQNFILAMFYGFSRDSTKVRRYSEAYDRYLPLQGGYYQGALEFTFENQHYRMERNFLKSNESCRVINLTTSTQVDSDPLWFKYSRIPQPGVAFFNMDQVRFKNFFLLDDLGDFNLTEVESQIKEQLLNLKESGDERISLSQAELYLQTQREALGTIRAKTSPLGKTTQRIEETELKLRETQDLNRKYRGLLEEDQSYGAKITEIQHRLEPLEARMTSNDERVETSEDIKLRDTRYKLMELSRQKMILLEKVEDLELENPSLLREGKSHFILPVSALIAFILFFLVYKLSSLKFAVLILILGSLGIYLLYQRETRVRRRYQEQLSQLDHLIYQERALIEDCPICSKDMEGEECIQVIDGYFSNQYQGDKLIFGKITQYKNQIHELELRQSKIRYELDRMEKIRREQEKLKLTLDQLYESRDAYLRKLASIDKTEEILNRLSKKQAGDGYERFEERLNAIFSKLTDGKYLRVYFGEDEEIFIQSKHQVVPLRQLSRGTKDQLFLSIRLALLELNHTEDVPLVIDDSFVHFDQERLTNLLNYLTKLSRQILLFSAHTRELDIINREGYSAHQVDW